MSTTILWFRRDLRLADNAALNAALQQGARIVPVYIHAPGEEAPWQPGAASRWWLHHSLAALETELRHRKSRLILRRGPSLEVLRALVSETGASTVMWNRRYEPAGMARDLAIRNALISDGARVSTFNASLLNEPWTVLNQSRKPFQVFTPFWNRCLAGPEPETPLPVPELVPAPDRWPASCPLDEFELKPKIDWAPGLDAAWNPGEAGAQESFNRFLSQLFSGYSADRNRPDRVGTSRLSPHLHFGEISPRQIWHGLRSLAEESGLARLEWRRSQFLTELGWREFAHHLLFHFPHTTEAPLREEFARFRWRSNPEGIEAWKRGRTGFPIVDAGMRELWTTGWMHNRVRMIVASFLVKDLLVSWREGADWFWDTLVDADLANNTLGWQWTAGCGADAAPWFRVFNPVLQGKKFDPEGEYVRRWCPELARLPNRWIHQPHAAPLRVLQNADVEPGIDYPNPIVSHAAARDVALKAYNELRGWQRLRVGSTDGQSD